MCWAKIFQALSHLICTDHSTAGTVFPILEMSNSRLRWFQPLAQNDTISKSLIQGLNQGLCPKPIFSLPHHLGERELRVALGVILTSLSPSYWAEAGFSDGGGKSKSG